MDPRRAEVSETLTDSPLGRERGRWNNSPIWIRDQSQAMYLDIALRPMGNEVGLTLCRIPGICWVGIIITSVTVSCLSDRGVTEASPLPPVQSTTTSVPDRFPVLVICMRCVRDFWVLWPISLVEESFWGLEKGVKTYYFKIVGFGVDLSRISSIVYWSPQGEGPHVPSPSLGPCPFKPMSKFC